MDSIVQAKIGRGLSQDNLSKVPRLVYYKNAYKHILVFAAHMPPEAEHLGCSKLYVSSLEIIDLLYAISEMNKKTIDLEFFNS